VFDQVRDCLNMNPSTNVSTPVSEVHTSYEIPRISCLPLASVLAATKREGKTKRTGSYQNLQETQERHPKSAHLVDGSYHETA